ncbi:von Willebrand factor type A domain-containing protein [Pseudohalocynthiibacter aestuariivivens]|uniref:von Willebrand factor type A domain-containing protein n=1 Tax=Pseudohalocynthiibacter aestuariivivens TaxID=1591409 RepID=A0ABV5JD26_9RHOB|nr:VWA domain-containing protein [Pseudohalocynthiibacter aestuariivivens]MBS9715652.1 VWA domain-containing protein [Pseudohalocynthiibacter aestuariivivens]
MTDKFDDLDALKAALRAATPAPDPAKKAANLRMAKENFARAQESTDAARLTSDHPETKGFMRGVMSMLKSISMKGALTATTSLAAIGLIVLVLAPENKGLLTPPATFEPVVSTDQDTSQRAQAEPVVEQEIAAVEEDVSKELQAPSSTSTPSQTQSLSDSTSNSAALDIFVEEPFMSEPVARESAPMGGLFAAAPLATRERRVEGFVADAIAPQPEENTEAFSNEETSPLQITSENPVSTFSIDVDTASYSVVRSSLMNGYLPDPDSVRVEEMVNYFPYAYAGPEGDVPFNQTVTVLPTPWNEGTKLVHIGIQGQLPEAEERPPLNLVFLIDTSGSMNQPDKLPLLIQSFRLMLTELRPEDQVAIVTYAGSAGQVLEPTPASERATIMEALNNLSAGGSTAGQAGLQQAYAVAEGMSKDGEIGRVILATDGDFNVGIYDPDELKTYIEGKRDSGTYLSVLGFGRGNLDDATMQALAQNGNGQAAYIDTLSEAQKVMVDQLSGALFPIANDVKIQVEFNPAQIAEYRLIGYETRALRREDFNNDAVDAGEIGAGHSVTAIYEVTPVGSDAVLTDALRYAPEPETNGSAELGFLKLRYKTPGEDVSHLIETPIQQDLGIVSEDILFASAIAGFGQLLRNSTYIGDWTYTDAIALASDARGDDSFGYRSEAVTLMRLAETLSSK